MEIGNVTALTDARAPRMSPPRDLREASRDFAALFCQKLLATAWNGQGFLSGGQQAEAFYDLLTWQYARAIAERDGFGVGPMLYRALGGEEKDAAQALNDKDVSNEEPNGATGRA